MQKLFLAYSHTLGTGLKYPFCGYSEGELHNTMTSLKAARHHVLKEVYPEHIRRPLRINLG